MESENLTLVTFGSVNHIFLSMIMLTYTSLKTYLNLPKTFNLTLSLPEIKRTEE